MKRGIKKSIAIMIAIALCVVSPLTTLAASNVTLDVKESTEGCVPDSKLEERELGMGHMKYRIPLAWKEVESDLTEIDGKLYQLNKLKGNQKSAAEQLYVFYFSNERYLLNQKDASDRTKIEKAIIKNILPNEHVTKVNFSGIAYPTDTRSVDGFDWGIIHTGKRKYNYFHTTYRDRNKKKHNAEFVFLPAGQKGMCCVLYVFTDSIHKADIINMLQKMETK